MEKNPSYAKSNLIKPIINLFANEKFNAKYRQFLSDTQNYKLFNGNFKDFMYGCIEHMEKHNKEVLDEKPPMDDPKALY